MTTTVVVFVGKSPAPAARDLLWRNNNTNIKKYQTIFCVSVSTPGRLEILLHEPKRYNADSNTLQLAALFYTPGASVSRAERPRHPADLRGPAGADVKVLHRRIHVPLHHALMKLFFGVPAPGRTGAAGVMGVAFIGEPGWPRP